MTTHRVKASVIALILIQSIALAQETSIRGFANVDFKLSDTKGDHSSFSLGQYDLYISSVLSDRFSFLGESVFEHDGDGFVVDLERALIKYEVNTYMNFIIGKHHTPIGYWNTAYHHGTLLQPTTRRPLAFLFEDEGGILPIHTTGIMVSGDHISSLGLGYDVLIGNGIGGTPMADNNNSKSLTLALRLSPIDNLILSGSLYRDKLSRGLESLQGTQLQDDISQQIFTGSLVYLGSSFEAIGEYLITKNKMENFATQTTHAYYLYTGYRCGRFVPYLLYDNLQYPDGERYYLKNDTKAAIIGLRFEYNFLTVIKLESHVLDTEQDGKSKVFQFQVAIGY